jgi:hypothetical protein
MRASDRSRIAYGLNSPTSIYLDIGSYNLSSGTSLVLQVQATYTNGGVWVQERYIYVTYITDNNPAFYFDGPSTMIRTSQTVYSIVPYDQTKTVNYLQWHVTDQYWNDVGYNGIWGWRSGENYSSSITLDPALFSPQLSDPWWDTNRIINLEVWVQYTDGSSWQGNIQISLQAAGGTTYNLTVNLINGSAPNGYAYVYIVDRAMGNNLQSTSGYLDGYGELSPVFNGIYDPVGTDQDIYVYYYDSTWNYLGYVYVQIPDGLSGDHSVWINGSTMTGASWM